MTAWLSEVLKISVRTSVSCSAQSFSTRPGILSGPAALRGLILDKVFLTSAGDRQSAWLIYIYIWPSGFFNSYGFCVCSFIYFYINNNHMN